MAKVKVIALSSGKPKKDVDNLKIICRKNPNPGTACGVLKPSNASDTGVAGAVLILAGVPVVVQSFVRFVVEGVGTPAPVAPTEHLVVGGLYRYVRNPIYIALAATIVGQALLLGRAVLFAWAGAFAVAVSSFVRWYEEPALSRRFGAEYEDYRRAVPAWWPRLRRRAARGAL